MRKLFSSLLVLILLTGCGQSRPGLHPVTGTVTVDGKPLEQGTITFESAGARPARGRIEAGRIVEVTTYEPNDGLSAGPKQVAIQAIQAPTQTATTLDQVRPGVSLLPARYANPATSGLSCEITAGPNDLRFELVSKP